MQDASPRYPPLAFSLSQARLGRHDHDCALISMTPGTAFPKQPHAPPPPPPQLQPLPPPALPSVVCSRVSWRHHPEKPHVRPLQLRCVPSCLLCRRNGPTGLWRAPLPEPARALKLKPRCRLCRQAQRRAAVQLHHRQAQSHCHCCRRRLALCPRTRREGQTVQQQTTSPTDAHSTDVVWRLQPARHKKREAASE